MLGSERSVIRNLAAVLNLIKVVQEFEDVTVEEAIHTLYTRKV